MANNIGQPTKLTPEVQAEICRNLAGGVYVETACILAGVCKATFYNWRARGEAGEQPYVDFLDATMRAEAQAETRAVALIQRAGEEDPRHLEWWLERKYSGRWGRKDKLGLGQDPNAGPQQHVAAFGHLTAEEAMAILGNGGPYRHEGETTVPDGNSDDGADAGH
jgi:hypothetical protein